MISGIGNRVTWAMKDLLSYCPSSWIKYMPPPMETPLSPLQGISQTVHPHLYWKLDYQNAVNDPTAAAHFPSLQWHTKVHLRPVWSG